MPLHAAIVREANARTKELLSMPTRVLILTTLLLVPSSAATWSGYGSHEPDNALDDEPFMWSDAPGLAMNRVYFHGFTTQGGASEFNPNVGALGTRFPTILLERPEAVLGVWVDCNGDGYIGLAETAVREYRGDVLAGLPGGTSRCPASTGPENKWNGQHNYNNWVTELIPIGPYYGGHDARVITDPDAIVWGDRGLPGGPPIPSCTLMDLPPGGARTTGRILDHADCHLAVVANDRSARGYDAAYDAAYDPLVRAGISHEEMEELRLQDARWDTYGHPLNMETLGDENEGSYVDAFDCSSWPPLVYTGDVPVGDDLDDLYVRDPDVPEVGDGSALGTVVYASKIVADNGDDGTNSPCDSDPEDNYERSYGLIEGEDFDVHEALKDAPTWNFYFSRAARGTGAAAVTGSGGAAGAPADLGLPMPAGACGAAQTYDPSICPQTGWHIRNERLRSLPALVRADLATPQAELPKAEFISYYANVGTQTTQRGSALPGGSGVYGFEVCGSDRSSVIGHWQCDPTKWYPELGCHYPSMAEYCAKLPRAGATFRLRDIDCYDGGIGSGLGLATLPAGYGPAPCRAA